MSFWNQYPVGSCGRIIQLSEIREHLGIEKWKELYVYEINHCTEEWNKDL